MVAYTRDFLSDGITKFGWEVGEHTYGRPNVVVYRNCGKLFIGKFCSISGGVAIFLGGDHRHDWVTTYPFSVLGSVWSTDKKILGHPASKGDVVIGHDVWIGQKATIMSGVTIGTGAVIANGAVVTVDVPDYGIAIGNPARTFSKRFTEQTIVQLLRLKWWDWEDEKIRRAIPLMCSTDIELFLKTFEPQP